MTAGRTTIPEPTATWTETLAASRDRMLAAARAGRHGAAILAHATAGRTVAAWTLDPAPIDPVTREDGGICGACSSSRRAPRCGRR